MKKIAIMADSNCGITQEEAKQLGVTLVPMPFTIDGTVCLEDIDLSQEQFYEKMMQGSEIFTSQPTPGDILTIFQDLLKEYDEVVHIPMSSGLSGSCQTALMLAQELDNRVFVVDSQHISIPQRMDVLDALELVKAGKTGAQIKQLLEDNRMNAIVYVTVTTLEYLAKGGRITPSAAALGGLLKIKPILQIRGEKLDSFEKTRTMKKAYKIMLDAVANDIVSFGFKEGEYEIHVAYSHDIEPAYELVKLIKEIYPTLTVTISKLSLSIATHTGPGALGIGLMKRLKI